MMLRSLFLTLGLAFICSLQFVPGVGVGDAHAQSYSNCGPSNGSQIQCATIEDAYNACMARVAAVSGWGCSYAPGYFLCYVGSNGGAPCGGGANSGYTWATVCPAGATWKGAPTFQCVSGARCLAHNSDSGFSGMGPVPRTWTTYCPASSCELVMDSPEATTVGSSSIFRGTLRYTGNVCGAVASAPKDSTVTEPKAATCTPAGAGQSVCIKPNGDHCYSGPIGRPMQFCWRAGETGQKTSADVAQARGPGVTTPSGTPPAGETLSPKDAPMQSSTALASGVTVSTTVQNYTTVSGTDAGTVDESDHGDAPEGGDGAEGGVTGGADCENPPQVTGDPLLANVILQTWGTRCAVESSKAVTSTGEIGDCSHAWTISGPAEDANVQKLKGVRAQICGSDADGNGVGDLYEGVAPSREAGIAEGDTNTDGSDAGGPGGGAVIASQAFGEPIEAGEDGLNFGGWSAWTRSCPVIAPIILPNGSQVAFSTTPLCNIMQTFGYLFLVLASLFSAKVMAGGIE